jgi:hypothetical protein
MNQQLQKELVGVSLTDEQMESVEASLCFVPSSQRAGFLKSLADRLRPIRDIRPSDINHHIGAVLSRLRTCDVCMDHARRQRPHGWAALDRRR